MSKIPRFTILRAIVRERQRRRQEEIDRMAAELKAILGDRKLVIKTQ